MICAGTLQSTHSYTNIRIGITAFRVGSGRVVVINLAPRERRKLSGSDGGRVFIFAPQFVRLATRIALLALRRREVSENHAAPSLSPEKKNKGRFLIVPEKGGSRIFLN